MRRFYVLFALLFVFGAGSWCDAGTVTGTITWVDENGDEHRPPRVIRREETGSVVFLVARSKDVRDDLNQRPRLIQMVNQLDKQFIPRVQVVQKGSRVRFGNADSFFHNVYSNDPEFNLGRYPRGFFEEMTFEETGVVHLFCDIHPTMHAVLLVVDTPLYSLVTPDWSFRLEDVPDGEYTLHLWSLSQGEHQWTVRVEGDKEIAVSPVYGAGERMSQPRRTRPVTTPQQSPHNH